jgi:predicted SprT family Zn-dependent metalloprotease
MFLLIRVSPASQWKSFIDSLTSNMNNGFHSLKGDNQIMINQFTCNECGLSFGSQQELDQHTSMVHSMYRCEFCGEYLNSETELDEHKHAMHPEKVH